ncbi:SMAD/FHA domain superfamily [Arabidopsis thaliana x Arabidopsis arenosa]|uniref:SMAD/FHA domain superfamily n=1 Tax=Arabidopsis thaliana x Arabidopsis arenosa TaxID=1240361 RepID=A0A8T2C693_9BRAS|nr:SMAD/FHA domain superfamily [Arabidopsis thaliana x Arabidopsis arenosa]KAG7594589.1 SMAD/FHA domain superfamily [Arabidopsis thaliana x Arabidopsis arenosa]
METRNSSKRVRDSTETSRQLNPTKGANGLVINNHTPAGQVVAEPKFPWAKLISQYPERPHCVITSAVFTVGSHECDLLIPDLFIIPGVLCELTLMKHRDGGPSVPTLQIKGSGVGPVVVNRKPYLKDTCVDLQGGDEVVFSTPWKHAYIFQPLKYENLSASSVHESSRRQAHTDSLRASVLNPQDIEFSFENFPYFLSDTTKDDLITSTFARLKFGGKFANYGPKLSTICPRILLSGPAGSEIYREVLAKALAKHYGAKLMIVDTLLLPGGSTSKEADSTKESDSRGAEQAAPTSTTTSKSYTFKTGDRVEFVFSRTAFASFRLAKLRWPTLGFKGKVILAFEDNESSKLGVIFDRPIADGNDLGGLCEKDHGFFCAASSLRLDSSSNDSSSNDDADKLAINEIFEVVSNESETSSLILMLKDIGKSESGNTELYFTLKSKLENLPENTVVIASQTQLDSPEEKSQPGASYMFSSVLLDLAYPDICRDKMFLVERNDDGKEILPERLPKPVRPITTLFPKEVTICLPEDEAWPSGSKKKLERDTEILKAQANITSIRAALSRHRLECPDLETVCIKDQSLSTDSADEVVDCAWRHQLMSSSEMEMKDDRVIISAESITHGLQMIQNKNKSTE